MREMLIWLTFGAAGGIQAAAGQLLVRRLLDGRRLTGGIFGAGVLAGAGIGILCGVCRLSEPFLAGAEAVWIGLWTARFSKTSIRESLFIAVFYEIGTALWQFLTAAGMGIGFCSRRFLDRMSAENLSAVWVFHILLAVWMFLVFRREAQGEGKRFGGASVPAVAGLIAVITLSEQRALWIPDDTLTMWTSLAVALIMGVLVFRMNRQYEMEREMAALKEEQAKLLERDYTALNQLYEAHARLFHDLHHHIGALRRMLARQDYDGAERYLDELQEPVREITDKTWTGDETVDFLINSKLAEAARDQIRMEAEAEFPRHTNIRPADLCAILGNLLDNGLEAARKIPEPENRMVSLTIRRIHQMVVIRVENTYAQTPEEDNGRLKTTKSGGLHGWGLKSARTAAEKYDGTVVTSFGGGWFRAVATLSFQPVGRQRAEKDLDGLAGESERKP